MLIHTFKALHLIGMVTWFAGLFYLVRLYVYHAEARDMKSEKGEILMEQYKLMQRRLFYIITWPGMVITWICGLGMLIANPLYFGVEGSPAIWLHVKLLFVVALTVYHLVCGKWRRDLENGTSKLTGKHFRMLNEIATLILVAVIFLAVVRQMTNFAYLFGGVVAFGVLLFVGIKVYKTIRDKDPSK